MEAINMTKQKKGFWLFIFSLIPGAGEMYMGFQKQGLSIMTVFWGCIALSAGTGIGWLIMALPILWFYSFFNVHNLKSLTEEEFYSVSDDYVFHIDRLFRSWNLSDKRYRYALAAILIFFGASILWNNFTELLYAILPYPVAEILGILAYRLPQILIAVLIILAGLSLFSTKKSEIEKNFRQPEPEKNYWEPYHPSSPDSDTPIPDPETQSTPAETHPYPNLPAEK